MANTTNLNLTKLAGAEKLKTFPSPYNDNMDAIDGAFGAGFGVSGKPTVNAEINSLADGLAIISNNNTHAAITAGQFVYVRGHGSLSNGLYVATSNISANGTLSGSNLTADSSGGLNTVYSTLNSKSLNKTTKTGTTSSNGMININMGVEQYDIISASYVGGIAIPYKANPYEWVVRVMDATLAPIASTSVSLEIIYTNKM